MRFVPKRPSIEKEGLKKYLDRRKDEHNGHGYDHFVDMVQSDLNYTKVQIAIEFGVDRATIYRWLDAYYKEPVV